MLHDSGHSKLQYDVAREQSDDSRLRQGETHDRTCLGESKSSLDSSQGDDGQNPGDGKVCQILCQPPGVAVIDAPAQGPFMLEPFHYGSISSKDSHAREQGLCSRHQL